MKDIIDSINIFKFFKSEGVIKALLASFINIIIYLILIVMVFGIAQGLVIPIDMFENTPEHVTVNLITFHCLLIFMALLMSWYPNFIFISLFEKVENVFWKMSKCGLIYYVPTNNNENNESEGINDDYNDGSNVAADNDDKPKGIEETESTTRKFFGMFLFILWSWILLFAYSKSPHIMLSGDTYLNTGFTNLLIAINLLFTVLVFVFNHRFDIENLQLNPAYIKIRNQLGFFSLGMLFFVTILSLGAILLFKWSWTSILVEMVLCFFLSIFFIIFREMRKDIFTRDHGSINLNPEDTIIKSQIKNTQATINFLSFIRVLGILTLLLILLTNIFDTVAIRINPVNIIMMNLIAFYTVLIIPIKVYLYLSGNNETGDRNTFNVFFLKLKSWHFTSTLASMMIIALYFIYTGNSLHELITLPKATNEKIELSTFYDGYKSNRDTIINPIMYAAYGGGLKANYWNSLILNEIDRDSFNRNVVSMSGVSGGGMGIGLYTLTNYQRISNPNFGNKINEIKKSNVLSLELSWLFGWDYVREMLPNSLLYGYDRSHRSMTFYSNVFNEDNKFSDKITFRSVYSSLFKHHGFYPNIIINSTSTKDKYGVVSAINQDFMFPGSIDLLDIRKDDSINLTLTYLEAISSCNRFPVISPAAKVPTKGHFVDGGYFENSGIMSLISFKKALEEHEEDMDEKIFDQPIKLVSIRNDKSNYLQSLLENNKIDLGLFSDENVIETNESSEILAILTTAGGLEKVPNYLRSLIKTYFLDEYDLVFIDLPYYITDADIHSFFGGILNPIAFHKVQDIVKKSNDEILNILGQNNNEYNLREWGVIEPPTARILSRPVEIYMQEMIKMKSVQKSMQTIFKPVKKPF